MNTKYLFFILMAFALNTSAFTKDCLSDCSISPEPGAFSYEEATSLYNEGISPSTFESLYGEWISVGVVNKAGDIFSEFPGNSFDISGLKNSDGSLFETLIFLKVKSFDGGDHDAVKLMNLGRKKLNQGPNAIKINSAGVCFSQRGYTYGDTEDRDSQFNSACRLLGKDAKKMICFVKGKFSHAYFAFIKK